jgi:NADH dehydrogenase/NADH:ubiquinone oxidoreductase subunit G
MKKIYINDQKFLYNVDYTILQLMVFLRLQIPRFCYHEQLSVAGNCRMCLIEDYKSLKPIIACGVNVASEMILYTETIKVKKAREAVIEFLLINHPLDCPICDQGGECDLQDITMLSGSDRGRYYEEKRAVLNKNFGFLVKTIMNRCIHCTRCVRFATELAGVSLGVLGRGSLMEIGFYIETTFQSGISGNVIDLCPVGALTAKPYSFTYRP